MSISFVRKETPELMFQCRDECFSWIHRAQRQLRNSNQSSNQSSGFLNMLSDVFSWEELRFFSKQIPWNMEIWREQWRLTADYTGRCLNPDVSPDFRVPLWTTNHPIPIILFSVPWKGALVLRILTCYDRMNKNEPCDTCLCVIYTRV